MDVQTREVYKRVSAGTEMKGGAGRDVNTAGVCVYACVCTWFTFSRRTLAATLCRRLPNINASLPAHSAACKRSVQPPRPTFGPPLSGWQRGPGISGPDSSFKFNLESVHILSEAASLLAGETLPLWNHSLESAGAAPEFGFPVFPPNLLAGYVKDEVSMFIKV